MPKTLDLYLAGEWTSGTGESHHALISQIDGAHIRAVAQGLALKGGRTHER